MRNRTALAGEPASVFKQELFRRLLREMFAGRWADGDRLIETDLAERFGVSRTPVRESLMELAAIGFIELVPNCGAVMRPCGPAQVREIYQVREILEAEATRLACGRLEPGRLDALARDFKQLLAEPARNAAWSRKEWAADRCLHDLIAQGCGNARLAGELARYSNLIQAIRETVGNRHEAQLVAVREHLAILQLLLANRPAAAAGAMRCHIRQAAEAAIAALTPNLPAPAPVLA